MGKAFKCDRCGELFEKAAPYEKAQAVIMIRDEQDKLTALDLCKKCQADFAVWYQNDKD